MPLKRGVESFEREAADDAFFTKGSQKFLWRRRYLYREFVEGRPGKGRLHALNLQEFISKVNGLGEVGLGEFYEAVFSEERKIYGRGKGGQPFVRADIGRGALSSYVLLPRREGEAETPKPVLIGRLPDNPSRHAPYIIRLDRHVSAIKAPL